MLLHRALTALIGIPLALVLIYFGGWWLIAAVGLLALLGLAEFYQLAMRWSLPVYRWLGYPLCALAVAWQGASLVLPGRDALYGAAWRIELPLAAFAVALLVVWALARPKPRPRFRAFATLGGVLYAGYLMGYLLRLRGLPGAPVTLGRVELTLPSGACWLGMVIVVCWGLDTAAYAVGKVAGRHKLCPKISPGKTVEGALGGLLAAVLLAAGLGRWLGLPTHHGIILGGALGIVGQLGDVFESVLKRRAEVKDSGSLLPGHGGVLDRFDSLLSGAPTAFWYLCFVVGGAGQAL